MHKLSRWTKWIKWDSREKKQQQHWRNDFSVSVKSCPISTRFTHCHRLWGVDLMEVQWKQRSLCAIIKISSYPVIVDTIAWKQSKCKQLVWTKDLNNRAKASNAKHSLNSLSIYSLSQCVMCVVASFLSAVDFSMFSELNQKHTHNSNYTLFTNDLICACKHAWFYLCFSHSVGLLCAFCYYCLCLCVWFS